MHLKGFMAFTILWASVIPFTMLVGCSITPEGEPGHQTNMTGQVIDEDNKRKNGVTYFRQHGRWHTLATTMSVKGPIQDGDGFRLRVVAESSVWRYNPESEQYDIPLGNRSPTVFQELFVDPESSGSVRITPTM